LPQAKKGVKRGREADVVEEERGPVVAEEEGGGGGSGAADAAAVDKVHTFPPLSFWFFLSFFSPLRFFPLSV
jgi:hypothetical protein